MAIADTIVPTIVASNKSSLKSLAAPEDQYQSGVDIINGRNAEENKELTSRYLEEKASSIPAFKVLLGRTLSDHLRADARKGIGSVLSALE